MRRLLVPAFFVVIAGFGTGANSTEFRAFFDEVVALAEAFDVAVAERYADDAVILATRLAKDGGRQTIEIKGQQWKEMIQAAMPLAEKNSDRSEFSDVAVEVSEDETRATIRASRYSLRKCYTDPRYSMVIERRNEGLRIVEEHLEAPIESLCEGRDAPDDLEDMIALGARLMNDQIKLPTMVDDETRLDAIVAAGTSLEYHYVLVNYTVDEMDPEALSPLQVEFARTVCPLPSLRSLVDRGADVVYILRGKDGGHVRTFRITSEDCE